MDKINKPLNILLVEDEKFDREIFKEAFGNAGLACKITECTDAEKALKLLRADASRFDITVIDHTLPGITGLDLSKKIKEEEITIPVVLLTGTGSEAIAVEAMKADIDDYIIKGSEIHKYALAQQILKTLKYHGENIAREKAEEELKKAHHELEKRVEERTTQLATTNKKLITKVEELKRTEEELQKSEEHFRQMIERSPVPMAITDAEGNVEYFNDKFIELFGWTTDDVRTPEEWWNAAYPDESYREKVQASWEKAVEKANATGKEIEVQQWRLTCKNGDLREIEFKMVQVSEDLNVITMNDITEHKRAEEQLEKHRQHLESLVEEQTAELTEANDKLHAELVDHWQTEEMLKLMALFAEMNPAPVLRCNKFGIVKMANPAAIKILGMKEEKGMLLPSVLPGAQDIEIEKCILNNEIISHSVMVGERFYHFVIQGSNEMSTAQIYGSDITDRKKAEDALTNSNKLLNTIRNAQDSFIIGCSLFNKLLDDLLSLTSSEYGFIGEVFYNSEGDPYLKTHAITDISWNEETRKFYEEKVPEGMEFNNLDSLFGAVMVTGETVISNSPSTDPRRCGIPNGHPSLDAFLGLPFHSGNKMIGMVGIANRPSGYSEDLVEYLQPFLVTCSNIIEAHKSNQQRLVAEEEVRGSKERFQGLVETTSDWVWEVDENAVYTYASPKIYDMLGYKPDEVLGKTPFDFMPPDEAKRVADTFNLIVAARKPITSLDNCNLHKNGTLVILETSGVPIFDLKGQFRGYRGIDRDITERKKAEESLLLFKSLIDQTNDAIFINDAKTGRILDANERAIKDMGYKKEKLLNMRVIDFATTLPDDFSWEEHSKELHEQGSMLLESKHRRKDGTTFPVEVNVREVDMGGKLYNLAVVRDITERKQAEDQSKMNQQQLIHADKMKSLGILVSGVAHEINNPNNFITLNSQTLAEIINGLMPLLEKQHDKQDDYVSGFITLAQARERIPELLAGIKDGSDRIQQTVKKLKNFARKGTPDHIDDVNINSVVKSAIEIVESLIRKSTSHLSVEYGDNLPLIRGNQQELEQVVINLITNSCQALPDNKRGIAISTLNDVKSKKVMVKVSDEGTGIPEDVFDNIMEPFVTTKRDSGGTGLGLSISFSIVQNHKGTLKFKSKVGKGTEATVTLPAMKDSNGKGGRNVN